MQQFSQLYVCVDVFVLIKFRNRRERGQRKNHYPSFYHQLFMSARSFTQSAATPGKPARVASHSHAFASPSSHWSDRLPRWSESQDTTDNDPTSAPQNSRQLDFHRELVYSRDNSLTTDRRLSEISESSSIESASAEFDGDISIVAPLGQEENTDLYSLQYFPFPTSATSKENKFHFPVTSRAISNTPVNTETNQTEGEPSEQAFIPLKNTSKESSPSSHFSSKPILKTLYLTKPRNNQQSQAQKISQEIDILKTGDTSVLSPSQQSQPSQTSQVSNQATDRPVWEQKEDKRHRRSDPVSSSEEIPQRSPATISSNCPPRMATSLEDITSLRLWKGIVAEFVGTLLLTLVGCGSCINLRGDTNVTSPVVQIALCFGLSVATVVWAIAHVSGGHVNPAVTCAMLATRKISLVKAVLFVVFQLIGAVVGAGILYGLTPGEYIGNLGCTLVSDKLTPAQGVGVELLVTFVLVFTVFASCDGKRKDLNGSAPLTIGLSVTMCHLWAIDFTGSSMNTARSFGPALIKGNWDDHWVYWVGPILGGVVAGLLYEHLFAMNASITKVKACMLSSDYDDEKYRAKKLKVRIIEEEDLDQESPNAIEDNGSFPLTEKGSSPA